MSGDVSKELVERMVALVRDIAKHEGVDINEARAIAALLPKPIDPDLAEARRIASEVYAMPLSSFDAGGNDDSTAVQAALAALKSRPVRGDA